MVRQIPFTKYEAALLLDAYLKVLSGDLSRMDSVKKCSQLLRAMAVNSGIEIDDIYRNVNGISFQMASMESAYQGKTIMKPATQLFTEIVQLFRENNKEYHDLLNKAKDMANAKRDGEATIRQAHGLCTTNPAKHQMILDEAHRITETLSISVEDAFFAYAKDKTGIPSQMLVDYLQKAADYCHLKQPLLGMTDAKAVHNAQKKVAEGKLLRFRFGKNAQAIRNVTQLYYAFIKSYHESKEDVITRTTRSMKDAVVEQAVSGAGEQTTEENVPTLSVEEISTLGEMVKTVESTTETPSEPIDDPLLVDFTQDGTYSFTKPVSYTYKDKVYPARSWNQIYVEICGLLFTDYRDAFMGIMNEDIPGYNALAFADERNYRRMQVPKSFAPGYYLESNLDATAIVRKMRGLHQLIRLGDKLRISYRRSEDKGGEISEEATSKEWIIVQLKARGLTYQDKRSWGGCLWIVGDHRLDAFVQECREKGYKLSYKADGCKTYPNCPVWWTKNHVEEEVDTSDFRRRLDESFRPFLLSGRNLARSTATQYSRSIEAMERFMLERRLNCTLDTNDPDEVQRVYDVLMGWEDFIDWNNQYHHQYSAALAQYVGYLRQDETDTKDTDTFNAMTIKDVAIKVLHDAGEPLTMSEIMRQIDAGQLYKFNSSNPTLIVYQGIRRYCKGMKAPNHAPVDVFDRFTDETGQIRYMLIGESLNATGNTEPQETASADDRWLPILQNSFPDGYILNDFLGQFQAAAFWQERYRDECPLQGDAIDAAMKAIGIVRDGRVFTKSDEDKQLISTICAEINDILAHYTAVYRSCIYDRYHEQLAACSIYTEQVMAQQLLSEAKSAFYLGNQVFVKRGQSASVIHDARKVLRNHGGPMSVSNIAKVLWFIPHDVIYHCLSADDESINIGSSTWMLAEHFPLTREGAGKIGDMLDEYFLTVNYVQASDLMPLLENRLPGIADDLNGMNNMAIFNIVAYYLRDRFSFTKAIIAPKGSSIDFNNLFKSFAAEHDTFTLADLETLAYELKLSMIYWESIYAGGAVRISKTDFVNARLIDFDVDAIDAVLQDFCPGDYLPLMAVSSAMMMHLPSVGYQWNGYLLQSYVFGFSKVFGLSYSSFGKTGYYGAMVRRSCKTINNYGSLIEQVLTDDDTWVTTADALDMLVKRGYQAVRKYKGIDTAAAKAKQNKLSSDDRG